MADDFVLNVKQIAQYPRVTATKRGQFALIQQGEAGAAYASIDVADLLSTALELGGFLRLAPFTGGIAFNGATLSFDTAFQFDADVHVPNLHSAGTIFVNGLAVATQDEVTGLFDDLLENSVWSVNGRKGNVWLQTSDILQAGAAPIRDAHFGGHITAPTPWNVYAADDTVATVRWVQNWACQSGLVVSSYNGRGGAVMPIADDVTVALAGPGVYATANTPPMGDASKKLATTLFVDNAVEDLRGWINALFETKEEAALLNYAPINSPNLTGIPTAPTANPGTNTGQIATTAYVMNAVAAATAGVASWNGRTGTVVMAAADITAAGGALLASPAFTGAPTAPTAIVGDNTTKLATCAFVQAAIAAIAAGVTSFNTRSGAVTLQAADITGAGGALLASPALSGTPTAPTPPAANNSTRIATTAYVDAAVAGSIAGVSSFNGRTGAVSLIGADVSAAGGALVASPIFTGVPTAPTAAPGVATQQLATCAFVQAAVAAATAGVSSFNTRTGAVTLTAGDVTGVGGALLASPTFTGTPSAPTAAPGTNSAVLATTAFVQAALASAPGGVSSFNTRTGAIVLNSGDVSAAGGALVASPTFTGTPAAPTPPVADNSTRLATTAFVTTALASAGGVSSVNGRAGAVVLNSTDIKSATGAVYRQSDTAPTQTDQTFWFNSLNGNLYVQYVDPVSSAKSWVIANNPPPPQVSYSGQQFPGVVGGVSTGSGQTTSASFTTPANSSISTVWKIRQQAAGGGGGGTASTATFGGSGAGAGQYKEYLLSGIPANSVLALLLGTGGQEGSFQSSVAPGAGGPTQLSCAATGTTIVCAGGAQGSNTAATWQYGGIGGRGGVTTPGTAGVTMLLDSPGQDATPINGQAGQGGHGGDSIMGFGSRAVQSGDPSFLHNPGFGGGGAGAWSQGGTGWPGGAGCIIIERVAG